MPRLSLADLVQATGGYLVSGSPEMLVDSFVIDTREARSGSVFFALKGERTDGHRFLGDAARNGASAAIVREAPRDGEPAPEALILVEDPVQALGACGSLARDRLEHACWIGVTGSNGKTSTKELIAAGLSCGHHVHRSPGNFNNQLGVPLTILNCPEEAEFVVVELAMRGPGEIAELTRIARPHVGLVTNIRAVHLEFFGSLDDIAAAKGELFALLGDDDVAVVNLDDPQLRVQAARHAGPRVTFGRADSADLRLEDTVSRFVPGTALTFRQGGRLHSLQLRMGGTHAAFNALAAMATLVAAGQDIDAATAPMSEVEPGPGRGRIHQLRQGIVLVDDCYNSSPAALASVLETLRLSEASGRRVLVMGDMLELGHVEGALHREAGKRAASAGIEMLCAIGTLARQSAETARRSGMSEVHHFADTDLAVERLGDLLRPGDLIVIKGSRGMQLERLVETLTTALQEAV